jgi:hypothetical protein
MAGGDKTESSLASGSITSGLGVMLGFSDILAPGYYSAPVNLRPEWYSAPGMVSFLCSFLPICLSYMLFCFVCFNRTVFTLLRV